MVVSINVMSAGLSFEKGEYFVSEGDGFVDVCVNLYERQGLTVALRIYTGSSTARGIELIFFFQQGICFVQRQRY